MDQYVYEIILLGAFLHAGWNAILGSRSQASIDPYAKMAMLNGAGAIAGLPLLFHFGLPSPVAYYYLLPSVVVALGYTGGLMWAYRFSEMSQVYPLVRGAGVLCTTLIATAVFHEKLSAIGWFGVLVLAGGVLLLSVGGGQKAAPFNFAAVGTAFFTSVMLGTSLTLDGMGGRASGNPHSYTALQFIGAGAASLLVAVSLRGVRPTMIEIGRGWKMGVLAGAIAFVVYWIFVWATTITAIPVAAALRDTSVLIGAVIGFVFLGDALRPARIVAAATILVGLALLRFQGYDSPLSSWGLQ